MSPQEITLNLNDIEGNPIGVLKINELKEQGYRAKEFTKQINNCEICFQHVPTVCKLDNYTPLLFQDSGNIVLLEETDYQFIFTPEKSNVSEIKFPSLENVDKIPVLTPLTFNKDLYGGILNFRSYVGRSFFDVDIDGLRSIKIPFEVRSKKMNYEKHYPAMIADLAKAASGLIFYEKSHTFKYINFQQRVNKSFYEDFMFLEYIFRPENLLSAYGYIRRDPHKILEQYIETVPTTFASTVGPTDLINIITSPENLSESKQTPSNWLSQMKNYVPKRISQKKYLDTRDTPENRFVKYFLELLNELIIEMNIYVNSNGIEGYPAEKIREYGEIIQDYTLDGWLKDVGELYHMPSNSQVLQKKEGYREILDYFLIFEFAFNFQWEEVKEDIKGYQKKLSELYEYWCYLKLTEILSKLQNTKTNYESLFDFNKKEWSIQVKRGINSSQNFTIVNEGQELNLELTYNKTFSHNDPENYAFALPMRPDYSLRINSDDYNFLIHFDAKYKCDLKTTFKNEDIYKMHTYKDAIKDTLGAYVLYPGRKRKFIMNFQVFFLQ
ncbi:DUF2357 domain-containing protein [Methanobacterium ferruginis]|uniref:DUF2357 domain-containing protein n=1 Tax=Methanobacterium ferruginis TaxID=710191 RepID=UPI002573BF55|nr:DUF2357 domain-containing protein [Methanobacterium ferruginis]BDZ68776.1 hypothetical protein GCM10025860_22240 [Methanobacterium ferruginis]